MNAGVSRRRPDHLILMLTLALVFILAARTPVDTDLYWHLAAGKQTWQTARPMVVDVFSFTRAGQPWINHSWLSQVILYGLFQIGGNLALGAWMAALATISMGLVYFQMRGLAIFRAFLILLACTVAAVVWSPRPQLLSLVLFALLGWILYRYKWQRVKQLWLLPPNFLIWSNLHGGWPLGFMLLGLLVVGEGLNHLLKNDATEVLSWPEIGQVVLWTALAVPCLVLHPNGLEILKIPFQTVEVRVLQQFIQEWASPDFHEFYQQPYLWLLLAVLAAFGLSGRKVDGFELLTVIWFGYLGLVARRNFGPFALAAAPVLSRYLWAAVRSWREPGWAEAGGWGAGPEQPLPARRRPRWQQIINLSLVGLFGMIGLVKLWVVAQPALIATAEQVNPSGAVQYLAGQAASGRILNEYNWGGYLVWAYPQVQVFVDGRTDLFGDEIIGEWIQIVQADAGWADKLARWKLDWVLIDPSRPLAAVLTSAGWIEVYHDDHSVLYRIP